MFCLSQNYGIHLGTEMCKKLLAAGTPGLHMYTLNLDTAAVAILKVKPPTYQGSRLFI